MNSDYLIKTVQTNGAQHDAVLQELYTHYYRMMVGYAMKFVKSEGDAEDIVQEAFISIWSKGDMEEADHERMMRLLYVSIRNRCLDLLKHQAVEQAYASLSRPKISDEDIENEIFAAELYSRIFEYIDTLPPRQRATLLHSIEGKTNAEIAEEMDVSVDTVKNQKYKAIATLRSMLDNNKELILLSFLNLIPLSGDAQLVS